ncbi:MAG: tRNA pseudouridine(55) synthase TruB [Candidatus Melainabacteria bacterium]|nr:tRNA pseudouridine(55) synthase TruB [Candidatus Melainabacteria bacterium]
MTSHDVVARVRRLTKIKRTGHGGTLDPLAEGVLPIAVGQACRLIDYLPSDKSYYAEILLGKKTATDDLEGEVLEEKETSHITSEQIEIALDQFRGEIKQHPPVYSAIRIGGQHLYDLARQGKAPEKAPERKVVVHELEIVFIAPPLVAISVHCSKGTYIRSLARDLGDSLGTGGCLSKLIREKAGLMTLSNSLSLDAIKDLVDKSEWQSLFTDPAMALGFEKVELDEPDAENIFHGRAIELESENGEPGRFLLGVQNGSYIALLKKLENGNGKPEVVFSDARVST